jgi:hypothetical protein
MVVRIPKFDFACFHNGGQHGLDELQRDCLLIHAWVCKLPVGVHQMHAFDASNPLSVRPKEAQVRWNTLNGNESAANECLVDDIVEAAVSECKVAKVFRTAVESIHDVEKYLVW